MAEAPDPDQASSLDPAEIEVAEETEGIMRNLMYRRLTSRYEERASQGDLNVPSLDPKVLSALGPSHSAQGGKHGKLTDELGQTLADIGDKIELKYRDNFRDMVNMLNLTPSTAYDTFASVARKLFDQGINWGRIIALFYFGLEIASSVINRGMEGVSGFLQQIVGFIGQFLVRERIARWIADNGGWKALIDLRKNTENLWFMRLFTVAVLGGLLFAFYKAK